jgi:hypothetical protein
MSHTAMFDPMNEEFTEAADDAIYAWVGQQWKVIEPALRRLREVRSPLLKDSTPASGVMWLEERGAERLGRPK